MIKSISGKKRKQNPENNHFHNTLHQVGTTVTTSIPSPNPAHHALHQHPDHHKQNSNPSIPPGEIHSANAEQPHYIPRTNPREQPKDPSVITTGPSTQNPIDAGNAAKRPSKNPIGDPSKIGFLVNNAPINSKEKEPQYLGDPSSELDRGTSFHPNARQPSKKKQHWLISTITKVLNSERRKPTAPPFKFELSREAARFNHSLLKKHGGDLDAIIRASPFNPMSYGSEFKSVESLNDLFKFHPGWPKMKSILANGTQFPLEKIPKHEQLGDLRANIKYGNHKSASGEKEELLGSKLSKEVIRGWNIPILPSHILDLIDVGAEVAPMGLANQASINERGEVVFKDRLTHDQSWEGQVSKTSINSRVIDDEVEPLFYGYMISRLINYTIALRTAHPTKRILLRKDDFKSAYRRQHLNGWTALKTIVKVAWQGTIFFLISLRLTFGGKPNPSEWCCIAEPICDLSNDILNCDEWNPKELHSPLQSQIPSAESNTNSSPYHPALPIMMSIPILPFGKCDEFIDDIVTIGVDTGKDSIARMEAAAPLAIATVARAPDPNDKVIREDFMSLEKMEAEGGLKESHTVLGWLINTRNLTIALPENKFLAWSAQIREILKVGKVKADELESLIGRLNHTAYVIPLARHFLSRLRHLHSKASNKWVHLRISAWIRDDLKLWLKFLHQASEGISMNLISFRQPTHIYITDSCEYGLGGFSSEGKAWRWKIPTHLRGRAHIGLLEFLAELVAIWMDIIDGVLCSENCVLAMGDSTNGIGWLKKSNFFEEGETATDQTAKLRTARKLAEVSMNCKIKLYGQWFPGADNIIPDLLSPAPKLQTCKNSHRNRLVSLLRSAGHAIQQGTTDETQAKRVRAWRLWKLFLPTIGIQGDDFLATFDEWHRQIICVAFCQAIREASFSPGSKKSQLVANTVRDTIGNVAQAFRSALRPDPRLDTDGNLSYILQQCLKGYTNLDPPEKQQKALPFSVLVTMFKLANNNILAKSIAQLATGAYFFAMRSCEYSKTGKEESKRTRILRLRNIRFFKNRKLLSHSSPLLSTADYVDITFEYQKNDERNDSVGMFRSSNQKTTNYDAVTIWAAIVKRLWSYDGTTPDTKINTVQYPNSKGKIITAEISSYRVRSKIRAAVAAMGKETLGFSAADVGCHSIRSGTAMALYLANVPVLTIMIIGRWKSDAFLRYIRKQVAVFSQNLTDKMLEVDSFFTTPDFERIQSAAANSSPTPPLDTENGPSRSWGVYHQTGIATC